MMYSYSKEVKKLLLFICIGPPGCGKTFIGVKIVQLLLSLRPKLNKPILLLTYKNHALDEFLKHVLKFCEEGDLVRIGGRSKEPDLEPCNLQSIMKSMAEKKLFSKSLSDEIRGTRQIIEFLESDIKRKSFSFNSKGYLTKDGLIRDLTDGQLRSFLLQINLRESHSVYKVDDKKIDRSWIEDAIDDVSKRYGSLRSCLLESNPIFQRNDQNADLCYYIFTRALEAWLPDRQELWRMKELQTAFIRQNIETKSSDDEADDDDGCSDKDSEDEDYVNQLLEARMVSDGKDNHNEKERRKSGLVLFPKSCTRDEEEILIETTDFPSNLEASPAILTTENLWNLDKVRRWQFLYCILEEKASSITETFNHLLYDLQDLKLCKQELEMSKKIDILSTKKIIGMTITGASINHDLLHAVSPSVVIVEEAAEILEPSLLAALTSSTEHLILIGDHKQLRPQVNTYELCRNFQFDVSMMERLVESKFPFKFLRKQNRMRPEFSELLRDIYPDLEDNLTLVSENKPLKCIQKSMFFWNHEDPEKKDRTYTNIKEAERVVALAIYLLSNGCTPSEITVLAAYLGQTKLLRKMLKQEKRNRPELFLDIETIESEDGEDDENVKIESSIQVQTIDMYQGDENKYVLISLVRSNRHGAIGFLKEMNRRCVAQSRAKCGMYFVGNLTTLAESRGSCWHKFITTIIDLGCADYALPLQCSKHGEQSKYKAVNAESIYEIINNPTHLCNRPCGKLYPCEIPQHSCKKPCFPQHQHENCPATVLDKFPECGHTCNRKCRKKISEYICKTDVGVTLSCGHGVRKECHQRTCDILCFVPVSDTFPRCGHKAKRQCRTKIGDLSCEHQCEEMNSCGNHRCKQKCGKTHGHDHCPELIDYKFTKCGHPSPTKKKCSEEISASCNKLVYFIGKCEHHIEKKCHENESDVKCPVVPCGKMRSCGHPCNNACGDDCDQGDCQHCKATHTKKLSGFKKAAKKRVRQLEAKITKKHIPTFIVEEIHRTEPTAAEYMKVQDQVTKFIQPCHSWFPAITKIEKVTNLVLEKKFEEAKSRSFGSYIDTKFHGTSDEGVKGITENGFKLPDENPADGKRGMFGQGIYFATDSSKSAQIIYTKGSSKLLLCQVILGNSMVVHKANNQLNKKKLQEKKFDSIYAPRGCAVKNDEFVIFDPDQALPEYVIHFSASNNALPAFPKAPTSTPFSVTKIKASRTVNFDDPYEMYYSFAESHYRRMASKERSPSLRPGNSEITSIDIVINKDLEGKFEATKRYFKQEGISDDEILAYHGTDPANIDSILKDNLQLIHAKRQVYGRGNYFSEFPSISLRYGKGLLLCRILPGKEFVDSTLNVDIPEGFNSKKVRPQEDNSGASVTNLSGEMIIIENSDQILPFFVIHLASRPVDDI